VRWNRYFKKKFGIIIISILIGAASHILWDSFTHLHGQFVEVIPLLSRRIDMGKFEIPVFKILQHLSTILGGVIILFAFWKMPKSEITKTHMNLKYWIIVSLIIVLTILTNFLLSIKNINYPNLLISGISGLLIALTITPFFVSKKNKTLGI
jgi:hypothetical protein